MTRQREASKASQAKSTKVSATLPVPANPRKRQFWVRMDVLIELDERLLSDVLTEEWRNQFYPLASAETIASHLAFNLIQDRPLGSLDGFADQDPERVELLTIDVDDEDVQEIPACETEGFCPAHRGPSPRAKPSDPCVGQGRKNRSETSGSTAKRPRRA